MTSLEMLPAVFRLDQALELGASKRQVYGWRDTGELENVRRGIFAQADVDDDAARLSAIVLSRPNATLCLASALERHGLSDEIPRAVDIALPRPARPLAGVTHVNWHFFDAATLQIGREAIFLDTGIEIGIYNAERTIVDVFRLRHTQGEEVAHGSLRRWLRQPGSQPNSLLAMARMFSNTEPAIRRALEVLL